ncbi:thioredoxin domain-containing protein, partial [Bdellovibrionota bacterium FG-2]
CMTQPETEASIQKDVEEAITLGVTSTPTYFINGHKIEGSLPLPIWVRIVEHLLQTNSSTASP